MATQGLVVVVCQDIVEQLDRLDNQVTVVSQEIQEYQEQVDIQDFQEQLASLEQVVGQVK